MSSLTCQHCGGTDIDTDQQRGDSVCTGCGSVLEENIIVSEVQFEENGRGGCTTTGQFVSSDGKSLSGPGGFHYGMNRESNQVTIQIGRRMISEIAQPLKLKQHYVDIACNFFKIAVNKRFTKGRVRSHVVAACLYLVCRTEEPPPAVMLLDLSDIIQVNVYVLGHTYVALSNLLSIKIPPLDPSLYVLRFAHKLELGDKTHIVSETALRLVQRMKRDWLNTGRRPSGLCGAALLVAARMHDFSRTIKDMIKIVKVCETTLKKRLTEFGDTPSSHLTFEEFMTIDLEEEQDPPAFKASRLRAKLTAMEQKNPKEVDEEIVEFQREIEVALQERPKGRYAKYAKQDAVEDLEVINGETEVANFLHEENVESIKDFLNLSDNSEKIDSPTGEVLTKNVVVRGLRPTSKSLGLNQTIAECMRILPKEPVPEDDGQLDLTGIDDNEIEIWFRLDENEIRKKTNLWNEANADYLKELKEKEERLAREKEANAGKPEKKKRKVTRRQNGPASTAGEAIEKMLQEKRISNKINYEVLWNLNENSNKESATDVPKRPIVQLFNTPLADKFAAIVKPFEANKTSGSRIEKSPSVIIGNSVKRPFVDEENNEAESNEITESNTEINVEPEDYIEDDQDEQDDQDDFDNDDVEEEEPQISVAKLFGQTVVSDYEYDEYDYDCDDS